MFGLEKKTREDSLAEIEKDSRLQAHAELINAAIRILLMFTYNRHLRGGEESEDEEVLSSIGFRLHFDYASALSLTLSGYYHAVPHLIRDILECGYLLYYFSLKPSEIQLWRNSSTKERQKKYSPRKLRSELKTSLQQDGGDDRGLNIIDSAYSFYCEYGVHPTFKGNIFLFSRNSQTQQGSYIDVKKLDAWLTALGQCSWIPTNFLANAYRIENLPQNFKYFYSQFVEQWNTWLKTYIPATQEQIDKFLE
jgi:hypothetical protein